MEQTIRVTNGQGQAEIDIYVQSQAGKVPMMEHLKSESMYERFVDSIRNMDACGIMINKQDTVEFEGVLYRVVFITLRLRPGRTVFEVVLVEY